MTSLYEVFEGSDGAKTKALYEKLEAIGAVGKLALNLFRAQKCSSRAKVYHGGPQGGGSFRAMAYDRKTYSIRQLNSILLQYGHELRIPWGWARDLNQPDVPYVLYIDLPQGQVSFHSKERLSGPEYLKGWDGSRKSAERILAFCSTILEKNEKRNLTLF
jgi:hypothetical protein